MSYYNEIPLEQGNFCFLTNLRNYLNYYNLKASEAWIGGIIGYMGFFYTSQSIDTKEVIHGRCGDFKYLFQCLQSQINKPLEVLKMKTHSGFGERLREMIENFKVMLVWINDVNLEYSPYYKLSDFWSIVLVLEVQNSNVIIFDNGIKELTIDNFMKSVTCDGEATFYYTEQKSINWALSEKETAIIGLNSIISRFEAGKALGDKGYYGDYGLEVFAEDLKSYKDSESIFNLYFQMNRPGGLSLTRDSMKKFYIELEEKGLAHGIDNIRGIYANLAERWRKIASLLFKLSYSEDTSLRDRIVKRIYETKEYERMGIVASRMLVDQMGGGK